MKPKPNSSDVWGEKFFKSELTILNTLSNRSKRGEVKYIWRIDEELMSIPGVIQKMDKRSMWGIEEPGSPMTLYVCMCGKRKKQYGRPGMRNMQCAQHISPFIVSDENFLIWNFFLFFPVLFLEFCQNLSYFPTFSLFGCFCPSCYLQFYSSLSPVFPFIFLFYFIFVNCSFFFSFFFISSLAAICSVFFLYFSIFI